MSSSKRWVAVSKGSTLIVMPLVDDDDDTEHKNALTLRNLANLSGRCPSCDATFDLVEVDESGVLHAVMGHENDCPVLLDSQKQRGA